MSSRPRALARPNDGRHEPDLPTDERFRYRAAFRDANDRCTRRLQRARPPWLAPHERGALRASRWYGGTCGHASQRRRGLVCCVGPWRNVAQARYARGDGASRTGRLPLHSCRHTLSVQGLGFRAGGRDRRHGATLARRGRGCFSFGSLDTFGGFPSIPGWLADRDAGCGPTTRPTGPPAGGS